MNDTRTPDTPARPRRRFRWLRRVFFVFVAFLLVVLAVGLGLRAYFLNKAEKRYQAAVEETDRLDPEWRWEQLLAQRKPVPDEKNSAHCVEAVAKLIPEWEQWPRAKPASESIPEHDIAAVGGVVMQELIDHLGILIPVPVKRVEQPSWEEEITDRVPAERLPEELEKELRAELERLDAALQEARRLADLPTGRYEVEWKKNHYTTHMVHIQKAGKVARLLQFDAALAAQEGNVDRALLSARAALNAGRSIGDEPSLLSVLVRIACQQIAIRAIERALALGKASPEALAALQELVEDEIAQPLLLIALRGERTVTTELLELVYNGEINLEDFAKGGPRSPNWPSRLWNWAYVRPMIRMNQAVYLEWMTDLVEVAKQPPAQQRTGFRQIEEVVRSTRASSPHLSYAVLQIPAIVKVTAAFHRSHALLQSTRAALAAERYRLTHGEWPESLEQLVPDFLDKVPDDPFQKKGSLRWLRLDDGIVIYSIGPDEIDDDGLIKTRSGSPPDYGFRLWDLEWRAQPPSP